MSALSLLAAAGWFVLGVVTGASWTRLCRDVRHLAQAKAGGTVATQPADETTRKTGPRRWLGRARDVVVVLLFVGSGVQFYVTYDQIQDVVACQAGYQAGFADALDARSKATQEAQDALDELMSTVGTLATGVATPQNRQRFAAALADYLDKRVEAKRQQQANPFPPSPRDICR